jgi:guanyl-specific ribonuclease Sa
MHGRGNPVLGPAAGAHPAVILRPSTLHASARVKPARLVLLLIVVALAFAGWLQAPSVPSPGSPPRVVEREDARLPAFLPPEAHHTLALIARGGPFPHRQDGSVFQNRERRLPQQPRGHYREYTVRTPGERTRGARRIVTGGDPPSEFWYTDDHYRSFRRFEVPR